MQFRLVAVIALLGAAPPALARWHQARSAAEAAARPRFHDVTIRGGLRLRYAEQGPTDGPVVILLHGYSDSWYSFSRLLPLLPAGWRVLALDQRGHGQSDRPLNDYGMNTLGADVLALMDALGIARAAIAGHSMGTMAAQQAAAQAPERVTHLVLIAGARNADGVSGLPEFQDAVAALTDPVDTAFIRAFQTSTVFAPVPAGFLDTVVAESTRLPARVWRGIMAGMLEPPADREALRRVRTLVLWGERDAVFEIPTQDLLRRDLPHAEFFALPQTGHAPHWERPEVVAAALARFIP